eukprot:1371779-Rhodomonas_salina.5
MSGTDMAGGAPSDAPAWITECRFKSTQKQTPTERPPKRQAGSIPAILSFAAELFRAIPGDENRIRYAPVQPSEDRSSRPRSSRKVRPPSSDLLGERRDGASGHRLPRTDVWDEELFEVEHGYPTGLTARAPDLATHLREMRQGTLTAHLLCICAKSGADASAASLAETPHRRKKPATPQSEPHLPRCGPRSSLGLR